MVPSPEKSKSKQNNRAASRLPRQPHLPAITIAPWVKFPASEIHFLYVRVEETTLLKECARRRFLFLSFLSSRILHNLHYWAQWAFNSGRSARAAFPVRANGSRHRRRYRALPSSSRRRASLKDPTIFVLRVFSASVNGSKDG